jgi:hypothetical protein
MSFRWTSVSLSAPHSRRPGPDDFLVAGAYIFFKLIPLQEEK